MAEVFQRVLIKALSALAGLLLSLFSMESSADPLLTLSTQLSSPASRDQTAFVRKTERGHAELDLSYIRHLNELAHGELKISPADFIPSQMKASDSELRVAQQIVGHSLEKWLSSRSFLNGSVGDAIRGIEQPLAQSIQLQDSSGKSHQIGFEMKAARAIASVTYTGLVTATMAYQITTKTLALEIAHRLNQQQKLVVNQTIQPSESLQLVGWQMSW